ncbi:phosphonate metabolism protein/1,5-bisphosphokinase (PRPP-forming) PhnN [Rhizobium sp. C1]|uniref:phosphonate metabolism protein/1,5-bisphosphokinase (PRPP-forming) PhnN n=1 Tax=Rhizobium sp. C1 TaxID=1349799 RepID=UPI001E2FE709|nr:phosphonate metabolism protein/1,5-bisphosphokinase (PRPP-forming) PhnN [Rhizobium sp. C1]MCD2178024.1 phosphonate metabolism protein/1,5-bisphosphokinase (PRPP-forming) PhnN [Rhizobium sp. C1]
MGAGTIFVVVGPSGAGKDSVMDLARRQLAGDKTMYRFVKRYITRPKEAGGEDHQPVDHAGFSELAATGKLALHWQAHGLFYGIPVETLDDLDAGRILIVNGSRAALPTFREVYGDALKVVLVTAPKDVLAERLAARGRESAESILQRLERSGELGDDTTADLVIVNDKDLAKAGDLFTNYLRLSLAA